MKVFSVRPALVVFSALLISTPCFSGEARSPSSSECDKTVEAAKKEGKLVAAMRALSCVQPLVKYFLNAFPASISI